MVKQNSYLIYNLLRLCCQSCFMEPGVTSDCRLISHWIKTKNKNKQKSPGLFTGRKLSTHCCNLLMDMPRIFFTPIFFINFSLRIFTRASSHFILLAHLISILTVYPDFDEKHLNNSNFYFELSLL